MIEANHLLYDRLDTPIGVVLILTDRQGRLRAVDFADHEDRLGRLMARRLGQPLEAAAAASDPFGLSSALAAYFDGDLAAVAGLPVEAAGTTFQRAVWAALRQIPPGQTRTYGQIAASIGHAAAVRAVGAAIGANAIAIVTPCHRVIGADGSLTGYAGGIERKQWLLAHEAAAVAGRGRPLH